MADNGGPTLTHALLPGSPAIDAVPAISCTLTTDQRGKPRPAACRSSHTPGDLGAFELQTDQYPTPTAAIVVTPGATSAPRTSTATSAHETPLPETPASPAALGTPLLPGLGLLGLLLLSLLGLAVVWRWRRGSRA